jgi:hypothetical protein
MQGASLNRYFFLMAILSGVLCSQVTQAVNAGPWLWQLARDSAKWILVKQHALGMSSHELKTTLGWNMTAQIRWPW